jgi:hypothetical protein
VYYTSAWAVVYLNHEIVDGVSRTNQLPHVRRELETRGIESPCIKDLGV